MKKKRLFQVTITLKDNKEYIHNVKAESAVIAILYVMQYKKLQTKHLQVANILCYEILSPS